MNNSQSGFANLRAKFERGGFLTKWKGHVASVAPGASVIALSIALGASPAAAQDITVNGTNLLTNGGTNVVGNDDGSDGILTLGAPNGVIINGGLNVPGIVDAGTVTDGTASMTGGNLTTTGIVDAGTVTDGTASMTGGNLTTTGIVDAGTLAVTGNSVFSGTVNIAGPTNITDTLDVQVGATTLDVNGSSFNVQVGSGPNSTLDVTSTSVELSTAGGSGFTASSGNANVTGTTTAVVSGGTSAITVSNTGVALSGASGAPVILSGVADPVSGTDAVNLRTMQRELGALESEMSAGIAQSMAMTQLPNPDPDKQYSFGVALGGFNGEAGLAMGGAARLEGNTMLRGAVSYSDAGGVGAAAGIGWSW